MGGRGGLYALYGVQSLILFILWQVGHLAHPSTVCLPIDLERLWDPSRMLILYSGLSGLYLKQTHLLLQLIVVEPRCFPKGERGVDMRWMRLGYKRIETDLVITSETIRRIYNKLREITDNKL